KGLNAKLNKKSIFARKNYFYPDLPKSYQITQDKMPIIHDGFLIINEKKIGIERAHLEEDAGKSQHPDGSKNSYVDLNRAGQPLLEIVTRPELTSTEEALSFLKKLHHLVKYINVCDGNMQEGSFRCDANVSIRYNKNDPLGTRVELKNINSFRYVEKAIEYEIQRQHILLTNNGVIVQETRLFNESNGKTFAMRKKENLADYRYFPEPDLPPVIITDELIKEALDRLPTLPEVRVLELCDEYNLSSSEAELLIDSRELEMFFIDACKLAKLNSCYKIIYNIIFADLSAYMNKHNLNISSQPITPKHIADLAVNLNNRRISQPMLKEILKTLWLEHEQTVEMVIKSKGLELIDDDDALIKIIKDILIGNPNQHQQYLAGKDKLFGFFVGQVMKASKGQANPEKVSQLLKELLKDN
ncbi:MAG: Asp-tRNA(Asn)/Glu-tRNA(Gln) amidotransferase subunit GatB, partial [Gammaproteobacteria bacterium]|nr:Asp-tRNA(Asn)/Glu-tRNA(Gln) amidotransferase subunit GatB [Gammaproteobacteria bacterium]